MLIRDTFVGDVPPWWPLKRKEQLTQGHAFDFSPVTTFNGLLSQSVYFLEDG